MRGTQLKMSEVKQIDSVATSDKDGQQNNDMIGEGIACGKSFG